MLKKILSLFLTASLLFCLITSCSEGLLGSMDKLREEAAEENSGRASYTVTFDGNSQTSGLAPAAMKASPGESIKLPSGGDLTKTNFEFDGWNTQADGLGDPYAVGDSFTVNDNTTLYAKWSDLYTVTFSGNDNTSGAAPGAMTARPGTGITLPSGSGLTRTGYVFDGWNTAIDGSGTNTAAGATGYTVNSSHTLHARWKATITFNGNSPTSGSPSVVTMTGYANGSITLPGPGTLTKSGSLFDGWNTNSAGNGTNYNESDSYPISGDATLWVKWNNVYTVTFSGNGNTSGAAPGAMTASPGSTITLPAQGTLARTGYEFDGWNTQNDGAGTNTAAGTTGYTVISSHTLYARWKATITFNGNSPSSGTPPSATMTGYANGFISIPGQGTLAKTGYAFGGWNTNSTGNGANYNSGDTYSFTGANGTTGTTTLWARWVYTVTFDGNGNTSGAAPGAMTALPGSTITLPSGTGLARTGYEFDGWNTLNNGAGTNTSAGTTGYTVTSSHTLYARWKATISFNGNGHTSGSPPAAMTGYANGSITLPTPAGTFLRRSHSFGGWNTNSAGNGTNYSAEASYSFTGANGTTGSTTLWAKWNKINNVYADAGLGTNPTLNAQFTWLATNVISNETYYVQAYSANESLAVGTSANGRSLSGYSNVTINLTGVTSTRTVSLQSGSTGSLFTINSGFTLILGNYIALQGLTTNISSLVTVNSDGALEMNTGSKITGNTAGNGGGVYVDNGSLTINGGEISGNTSGAGGIGGGGVYITGSSSSFIMSSGSISANILSRDYENGGGVYLAGGNFTMSGGSISNNVFPAVNNTGGGVYMIGDGTTFNMNGGSISGNDASGAGTVGGGVYLNGGTFTMSGTAVISGNSVTTSGGGVAVGQNNSKFIMNGGTISGNTAAGEVPIWGGGGGVTVFYGGSFTKNGGTITGYASDPSANGNMAGTRPSSPKVNYGHAVYANKGTTTIYKDTTSGITNNLSFDGTGENGTYGGTW